MTKIEDNNTKKENREKHTVDFSPDTEKLKEEIIDNKIEKVQEKSEIMWTTPTYELLKGTKTEERLIQVVQNPTFETYGTTAEKRLENIMLKINTTIKKYLITQLGIDIKSTQTLQVIDEVITPALERYLMSFLRDNQHTNNIADLTLAQTLSFSGSNPLQQFTSLLSSVGNIVGKATTAYGKMNTIVNAIEFLEIHKEILPKANKNEILSNPLLFKEKFLENAVRASGRDVYSISLQELGITFSTEEKTFGMSAAETQKIKDEIGNINVVDKPDTTKLILDLTDKAGGVLEARNDIRNGAIDRIDSTFSAIKGLVGTTTIKGRFEKLKGWKVFNFVLQILGFTRGVEGLQRKRYERNIKRELDTDPKKSEQISAIFTEYIHKTQEKIEAENTLPKLLEKDKSITFTDQIKPLFNIDGKMLAAAIKEKITTPSSLNPAMLKIATGRLATNIDEMDFERNKDKIIQDYITNMTKYLLATPTFLSKAENADTVAFTMITALFADPENVINGIEAKVLLPSAFIETEMPQRTPTTPENPTTSPWTHPEIEIKTEQKAQLTAELQKYHSPITAEMLVNTAKKYEIPVSYLAAIIKNDSSYGTAGKAVSTKNPWNVGNTDNGSIKIFETRESGLDACAEVIQKRIEAYKNAYPTTEGFPPIKQLLENRGPDGKGFLPEQANYQQPNPYRVENGKEKTPIGAYMTAHNGPTTVARFVDNLNDKLFPV